MAGRDATKWVLGALIVAVAASQVVVMRQNLQLRRRVAAASMIATRTAAAPPPGEERRRFEEGMDGRCRPFSAPANDAAANRQLDATIYFSIDHDCMSCVTDVVNQWNELVKGPYGKSLKVHGYTTVDGALAQKMLDQKLKPAFPVTHVDGLEEKLAAVGARYTPVVFVSDPATGRVLFTRAPLPNENGDRSIVLGVQALMTPCR
ncbi:MAG TPA: hypothetical protein VGF69_26410 [Thermoanaerobaculia bacterium]|jgi:hypothetical protein